LTGLEKVVIAFLTVVICGIVGFLLFFFKARKTLLTDKVRISEVAKEVVGMKKIDRYYTFTRKGTYLGVLGKDRLKKNVYVLVKDNGNKAIVLDKDQGITEEKASSLVLSHDRKIAKVTAVELGIYNKKPVWEVVAKDYDDKYNYYLLDFKTGKKIKENTAM